MIQYSIELKDKTKVNLLFNMMFLARCQKLMDNNSIQHTRMSLLGSLAGKTSEGTPIIKGGILDDIHIRAIVIASAMYAYNSKHNNDFTELTEIHGYEMMENMTATLNSKVWVELYAKVLEFILAEDVPNVEAVSIKKKAVKKAVKKPSQKGS